VEASDGGQVEIRLNKVLTFFEELYSPSLWLFY
jgi:hypothetical protein